MEISSSSIGGILFEQNKKDKPKIISTIRVPVNFLFDVSFEAFWRCTCASFKSAILMLLKDYPSGPDECLCIFLFPWFTPQSRIINFEREEPIRVDRKLFDGIIKSEEEIFKTHWRSSPESNGQPEFIEHEILKVELNGYYTKDPIGKKTKTIKIYFYMSLGSQKIIKEIKSYILDGFGGIPLIFRTFPYVSFSFLRENMNTQEGFVVVDMRGEMTDISLFRKDNIEEIVSFPKGRNFFLRKIASKFNTFPQEASSLFETYLKKHAEDSNAQKISFIIEESQREWRESFKSALEKISGSKPLPQNIFFIGDEAIGNMFIKCAEGDDFAKFTIFGQPFNVSKILFEGLNQSVNFNMKRPAEKGDVFLLMESIFANKNL